MHGQPHIRKYYICWCLENRIQNHNLCILYITTVFYATYRHSVCVLISHRGRNFSSKCLKALVVKRCLCVHTFTNDSFPADLPVGLFVQYACCVNKSYDDSVNNIQSELFKIKKLRQVKFGEYKTVFNLFSAYEICSIRIQGKLFSLHLIFFFIGAAAQRGFLITHTATHHSR